MLLALIAALVGTAAADDETAEERAERVRQQDEIQRLAARNAWAGVDATYRRLVAMPVSPRPIDHVFGARAALATGRPILGIHRLERVPPPDVETPAGAPPPYGSGPEEAWEEAKTVLARVAQDYGLVSIAVDPERIAALQRDTMPFGEQERGTIERARDLLAEHRTYKGLLPVGVYVVDGEVLEVGADATWQDFAIGPQQEKEPDVEAEKIYLQEEVERLALRGVWRGVDEAYRKLVALPVTVRPIDHVFGARAALAAGDQLQAYHRMQRVPAFVEDTPGMDAYSAASWREAAVDAERVSAHLQRRFGLVALAVEAGTTLVVDEMPFGEQERKAVARARAQLAETGLFKGYLPAATYEVGDTTLELQAGTTWQEL